MISIFRKIRKKLSGNNKLKEYLIYAIGEILLLVIGILIALQVNNWNQSQKAFNEELQLYSNILDDLNSEYTINNGLMTDFKAYQDLHQQVYNESMGKAQYDSNRYYNYLLWYQRFNMFIKEKYSSSLALITNNNIYSQLKLYMKQESRAKDAVDEWNEHQLHTVRPFLSKYGINNTQVAYKKKSYNLNSLLDLNLINHSKLEEQYGTNAFDQLLFTLRFKTAWMYQNFIWLNELNNNFQKSLEDELKRQNIKHLTNKEKYNKLIREAKSFYNSKDYYNSSYKYKEAFEQSEPKLSDRYDAARSFSLAEDGDAAFIQLFILVNERSYYERITTEKDFDYLKKDRRWSKLVAIIKSNKEEAKKGK